MNESYRQWPVLRLPSSMEAMTGRWVAAPVPSPAQPAGSLLLCWLPDPELVRDPNPTLVRTPSFPVGPSTSPPTPAFLSPPSRTPDAKRFLPVSPWMSLGGGWAGWWPPPGLHSGFTMKEFLFLPLL